MSEIRVQYGKLEGVDRCPQCGVANPYLRLLNPANPMVTNRGPTKGTTVNWCFFVCSACDRMVMAESPPYPKSEGCAEIARLYPQAESVDEALPSSAQNYLRQAMETLHAPDASVVMSGSAVDAMLKAKEYESGSLFKRIERAVEDHLLTEDMGRWAHAVRLEGNNVRHADEDRPHMTRQDAEQVLDFARALGDFLFVLTARVESGIEAAKASTEDEAS